MPSSESASTPASSRRLRAKHACRVCNARRVKCNVTEVQPCTNCAAVGDTCEVMPSRRGRYPRRSKHDASPSVANSIQGDDDNVRHGHRQPSQPGSSDTATPAATAPPSTARGNRTSHRGRSRSPPATALSRSRSGSLSPTEPGALFFGESNFLTLVPGRTKTRHASQSANSGKDADGGGQRLVFPVPSPQSQAQLASGSPAQAQRTSTGGMSSSSIHVAGMGRAPSDVSAATLRYLHDEGALNVPDLQTCLPAIRAYFAWFHPCFPILDRADTSRRLADGSMSRLLLHAVLFIGATYCDDATITAMGFADRSEAKARFYARARILFHADWETDRMALIQALFLMSFWRGGPEDVRDVRYWLGVVITVAESVGLHRSRGGDRGGERPRGRGRGKEGRGDGDACLRRRIWWSIYVRERQAAVSLGLPSRIRDEDCDVEPLTAADLQREEEDGHDVLGSCQPQHVVYIIKMVEIASLLGRIMDVQFLPGRRQTVTATSIEQLDESLEAWKENLPSDMQYSDDGNASLWTCLLQMAYSYCRILIHRHGFLHGSEQDKSVQVVVGAAFRISRIAEDMSVQGTLRFGQFHLVTSLFGALCIHTLCIRRRTDISRRISIHRARLCLLCLGEVQKYWRINNNILNLFLHYLDGSIAKHLHPDVDPPSSPKAAGGGTNATEADDHPEPMQQRPFFSVQHAHDAARMETAAGTPGAVTAAAPHLVFGDGGIGGDGRPPQSAEFLHDHSMDGLANSSWDTEDALLDLGMYLQEDDFMQEGLGFLGRSL